MRWRNEGHSMRIINQQWRIAQPMINVTPANLNPSRFSITNQDELLKLCVSKRVVSLDTSRDALL